MYPPCVHKMLETSEFSNGEQSIISFYQLSKTPWKNLEIVWPNVFKLHQFLSWLSVAKDAIQYTIMVTEIGGEDWSTAYAHPGVEGLENWRHTVTQNKQLLNPHTCFLFSLSGFPSYVCNKVGVVAL